MPVISASLKCLFWCLYAASGIRPLWNWAPLGEIKRMVGFLFSFLMSFNTIWGVLIIPKCRINDSWSIAIFLRTCLGRVGPRVDYTNTSTKKHKDNHGNILETYYCCKYGKHFLQNKLGVTCTNLFVFELSCTSLFIKNVKMRIGKL